MYKKLGPAAFSKRFGTQKLKGRIPPPPWPIRLTFPLILGIIEINGLVAVSKYPIQYFCFN